MAGQHSIKCFPPTGTLINYHSFFRKLSTQVAEFFVAKLVQMVSHKIMLNVEQVSLDRQTFTNRGVWYAHLTRKARKTLKSNASPAFTQSTSNGRKTRYSKAEGEGEEVSADLEQTPGPCFPTAVSDDPAPLLQRAASQTAPRTRSTLTSALPCPPLPAHTPVLLISDPQVTGKAFGLASQLPVLFSW